MDYERIASDAILETCAERRADFLKNALARSRAAIATYGPGTPSGSPPTSATRPAPPGSPPCWPSTASS